MSDTNPRVESARSGSTELITLRNESAFNALNPNMITGLTDALRSAARDRRCRAVVITGAGERSFCAGIDVKSVAARDSANAQRSSNEPGHRAVPEGAGPDGAPDDAVPVDAIIAGFQNLHHRLCGIIRTINTLPIPVIAAVNGHAIGAGFAIAAAADMRIIGERARFADGFVKRGISGCEMGLSYFLPRLVGASTAFDWMMTGRNIAADEAFGTGFASAPVDPATTVDVALSRAEEIASLAPMAVEMTKEVMWANLQAASLDQALALESRTQAMVRTTADAAEARQSFLDKRSPIFATPTEPREVR